MSRARDRADGVLHNRTHEDTDGGRESLITFKGEQSGGEISTLAQIQASHDGTSDDEKADLIFKTNDGSDGASPTSALFINSDQNVGIGGSPVPSSTGYNRAALHLQQPVTSSGSQIKFTNGTSGHADTDGGHISYWSDSNFYYNNLENGGRHRFYAKDSSGTGGERVSIDSDGLKFNGDTAAENSLSDYEDGTYTPQIKISNSTSGIVQASQNGTYTKVGRLVCVTFRINLSNKGSNTGFISFSLPFTARAASGDQGGLGVASYLFNFNSITNDILGLSAAQGGAVCDIFFVTSGSNISNTNINDNSQIACSLTYYTD